MKTRKTYTKEFKLEAVRLLEQGDQDASSLSRQLGVRRNQLYKWQKELRDKGDAAFKGAGRTPVSPKQGNTGQVEQLKRENDRLREEVEILKKAAAYFARELK